MIEIAFSKDNLPDHAALAAAYLAAAAVLLDEPLAPAPQVHRINEDYGYRQEEHYTYGAAKERLCAHAVGLMSGHGRHGTKTTWTGEGIPMQGSSQRYGLGQSFARLTASPAAEAAFAAALERFDVRALADGAARAAVDEAVSRWGTGPSWSREALIADLQEAHDRSELETPGGATVRFLLARLLLLEGALDEAAALLDALALQGLSLAFCRGIACGLSEDGGLWYVYRPHKTPPPWPHLEVRLAQGRLAELRGDVPAAIEHYQASVAVSAELRGGIRPDREALKQLERLGVGAV